jgi:hypothetical protein
MCFNKYRLNKVLDRSMGSCMVEWLSTCENLIVTPHDVPYPCLLAEKAKADAITTP